MLTPSISGPLVVDSLADIEYHIGNLDTTATEILFGTSARGTVLLRGFVNNGDGTGSVRVTFGTNTSSRLVSVVVSDGAGIYSLQSNVLIVQYVLMASMAVRLALRPQRHVWSDIYDRLLAAMPVSFFRLTGTYTIPYSSEPLPFDLDSVRIGEVVSIAIVPAGARGNVDQRQVVTHIPTARTETIWLQLAPGLNTIIVSDSVEQTMVSVAAVRYGTILAGYAREIFNYSGSALDDQLRAINSQVTTRIIEPYLPWLDLLPNVQSLRTLGTKLAVRSKINELGTDRAVIDVLSGVTSSTVVLQEQSNSRPTFDLDRFPLVHSQEAFFGTRAHVWIPNDCLARWTAFLQLLRNMPYYRIDRISEVEVVFRDEHGAPIVHSFDNVDESCSLYDSIAKRSCFDDVRVSIEVASTMALNICAGGYPFDLCSNDDMPFTPLTGESGDGGADPLWSNLEDWCVTHRFDGEHFLDSLGSYPAATTIYVPPPTLPGPTAGAQQVMAYLQVHVYGEPACVYDALLVSPHILASATTQADVDAEAAVTSVITPARWGWCDAAVVADGYVLALGADAVVVSPYVMARADAAVIPSDAPCVAAGVDVHVV